MPNPECLHDGRAASPISLSCAALHRGLTERAHELTIACSRINPRQSVREVFALGCIQRRDSREFISYERAHADHMGNLHLVGSRVTRIIALSLTDRKVIISHR
jgi:hypothetical protein